MAEIFRELDPAGAAGDPPIPYRGIADSLFHQGEQRLIPFLGAGASLETRPTEAQPGPAVDVAKLNKICEELDVHGAARVFLEVAARIAVRLQQRLKAQSGGTPDPVRRVEASAYPPSAYDLADAFCDQAHYKSFADAVRKVMALQVEARKGEVAGTVDKRWDYKDVETVLRAISEETGLCSPASSLLPAASYYEYAMARTGLCDLLQSIFKNKKTPTRTHGLLAEAAKAYLESPAGGDYLIVTTNYDGLLEGALDELKVPYYVLTVGRGGEAEGRVLVRFSNNVEAYINDPRRFAHLKHQWEPPRIPKLFSISLPKPLVCIYKIHGCLCPTADPVDSLIITDEDYVWHLNRDASAEGVLPESVRLLLQDKGLLFLGYSFNDWNIRSHYRSVVRARVANAKKPVQDYSVMREVSTYEKTFFSKEKIHIFETTLDRFVQGVFEARATRENPGPGERA